MAWAIRTERNNRATAEMASHAVEVLYGMKESGEQGMVYQMTSDCSIPAALPKGYVAVFPGQEKFEENAIAQ